MPRIYIQRARADSAAATRSRIIEAARSVVLTSRSPGLDLAEVALAVPVARSTIYATFGSRSGFLAALIEDTQDRAGFGRLGQLMAREDAVDALEAGLRQGCRMYAAEHEIMRRLLLFTHFDPQLMALYELGQRNRASSMRHLARRLKAQGKLRSDVSVEQAEAGLWLLTSFEAFDQLFSGWRLGADACARQLLMLARGSLLG